MFEGLYPARCPVCDKVINKEEKICKECYEKIHFVNSPVCFRCGKPLERNEDEYCEDCIRSPKSFERGFAVFEYGTQMQKSMVAFKYHNRRDYKHFYVSNVVERYGDDIIKINPDAFVPIPVHRKKKRKRGYNQAELLAKELEKRMKIKAIPDYLIRGTKTTPQKDLSPSARLKNLQGAFYVNSKYQPLKKVMLVDDIYTTGATMEACTRLLKKYGVEKVYCLSVCIGRGR